jgi:branched-chain amino acid transport system substrate-binding protein
MKKFFFPLVAALVILPLSFSVGLAAGPTEIRIGACESATGMFSGFATGGIFGMKTAVADINKQGGVFVRKYNRKLPVKLIVVDNQSDPAKAGTLATNLILRDKVHLLMNSPGPATMFNPQSIAAERNKIPYIAGEGPLEPWQAARMSADPPWQYTWGFGFAIGNPAP